MQKIPPRAIAALSVVAATFFLTIVVAMHGAAVFANPAAAADAPLLAKLSNALVVNLGVGVWALLLVPMAWAAVVYFEERTPDLLLRLVGTVVLALSLSMLWGAATGGVWAGHVGNAVAGAVGTTLTFVVGLPLLFVSTIFATDWGFHTVRRAGRTSAEEARPAATAPANAELLVGAAEPAEREFVVDTPRAAVAAAEMDEIVEHSEDVFETPAGWDETEDEGRTVIAAPTGYRGVEFLPQSDELALPETRSVKIPALEPQSVADDQSVFSDDEFVATPEAAFFVTRDEGDGAPAEEPASEVPAEDPVVAEAVETLFAAVTEPEPQPESGIGLPDDSPFRDEFFGASEAGWPFAAEPAPAAPATNQIAPRFTMPEEAPAAPVAEAEEAPAFIDEMFAPEAIVSRIPASAFEDYAPEAPTVTEVAPAPAEEPFAEVVLADAPSAPEPVPEPVLPAEPVVITAAVPVPEPQLSLFAESAPAEPVAAATAVATMPELNLAVLHSMELDPLFRDAVNAILERGRASAVVLQRQLGIGYARGIRILDQMTMAGLTGPDTPTGTRELRLTREAWDAFTAS